MPTFVISIDIGPGDHRPVRRLYTRFRNEIVRGRSPGQVSVSGSFVVIRTPETAQMIMERVLVVTEFLEEFDRVSIIDLAARRILTWGKQDDTCSVSFPTLIEKYIGRP